MYEPAVQAAACATWDTQGITEFLLQTLDVPWGQIRQMTILRLAPDAFHRIDFRGMGREPGWGLPSVNCHPSSTFFVFLATLGACRACSRRADASSLLMLFRPVVCAPVLSQVLSRPGSRHRARVRVRCGRCDPSKAPRHSESQPLPGAKGSPALAKHHLCNGTSRQCSS